VVSTDWLSQEKQSKEDGIVAILEKVVKMQGIIGSALPSQKKFKEMQDELEYKKMQLENTQTTQERLKEVRGREAHLRAGLVGLDERDLRGCGCCW
jgi:hypothetical protein